jgi:hypothetical protein
MSSMPGAVVIAKHYGEAMVLYSAVNRVEAVVDGAPVGKNGRLFIVEKGKAVKLPYEAGRFILEHKAYTGVVRVAEEETETGVNYDIEAAKRESLALTAQQDDARFQQYISDVVTDYLNQKKPAPRTPEAIQEIIDRRGYDLTKYGIFPLGQKETENQEKLAKLTQENADKDAQLLKLQQQMADLANTVAALKGNSPDDDKGKKKG